jgi:hypothetical protein
MKKLSDPRAVLWLLLALLALAVSGCATFDDEASNDSARPWNAPKGWDSALPSNLTEGR